MATLTIVVDAPHDPTTHDPHDVATDIVYTYNDWADCNNFPVVRILSAEWGNSRG